MNASTKDQTDLDDLNESELTEEENHPRENKLKKTLKSILITFLSVLCITGGILLHKMHSLSSERYQLKAQTTVLPSVKKVFQEQVVQPSSSMKPASTAQEVDLPSTVPTQNAILPSASVATIETVSSTALAEAIPVEIPVFEESDPSLSEAPITSPQKEEMQPISITQEQTPVEQEELLTTAPVQAPVVAAQPPKKTKMSGFTLSDALIFKEHFLTEESCLEDYQKLQYATHKNPQAQDVLNDLSPYCLTNHQAVKNVREAFLSDKKQALIVSYREKNPRWIAYLKAIPASLVEIRKINPTTNKPKDILYKAQNEIDKQNVSKAVNLVTQLPLSMQSVMNRFYREAAIYNRAKNSIDMLILSFEDQGE